MHMWGMPHALARTDQRDQNSISDNVCSILYREIRRLLRSQRRKEDDVSMTIGEQKTRQEAYSGEITALFCIQWHTDKRYQESQLNHEWTEEYCRFLDYLATVDITFIATWSQRSRYHKMLVLKLHDGNAPRKMSDGMEWNSRSQGYDQAD